MNHTRWDDRGKAPREFDADDADVVKIDPFGEDANPGEHLVEQFPSRQSAALEHGFEGGLVTVKLAFGILTVALKAVVRKDRQDVAGKHRRWFISDS